MSALLSFRSLLIIGLVIASFFVVGITLHTLSHRRYRFLAGRVSAIIGGLGDGKSAFAVARVAIPVAKAIRSRRGLRDSALGLPVTRIITNFDFWPEVSGNEGVEVIKLIPDPGGLNFWQQLLRQCYVDDTGHLRLDALVIVDEVSFYAPSDERAADPVGHLFWKYARKFNCELWWLAQDHMQVHKRLRVLTRDYWFVREHDTLATTWTFSRWHLASRFRRTDAESNNLARPEDRIAFRLTRKVRESYDTREAIASDLDDLYELQAASEYASSIRDLTPSVPENAENPRQARQGFSRNGNRSADLTHATD